MITVLCPQDACCLSIPYIPKLPYFILAITQSLSKSSYPFKRLQLNSMSQETGSGCRPCLLRLSLANSKMSLEKFISENNTE